jgi:hypothetical protein
MSWIAITDADVLDEITPAENATLKNIQGATDKLPRILARAVAKFRGAIQAGGMTLGAEDTLPESIADDVVAFARWKFLTAIPQAKAMQTEERKLAWQEALKVLEQLRSGEFAVENPDDSTTSQTGGGVTHVSADQEHPFSTLGGT